MIRIGVLSPSEIAFRRGIPGIIASDACEYAGVAHASLAEWSGQSESHAAKCSRFLESYGGRIYDSFEDMLSDPEVDAVYIPLPPSEHLKWTLKALSYGKHVLTEKPSTIRLADTMEMIEAAGNAGLALHENYAYAFHAQVARLQETALSGRIGDLRLIRATFSFPYRGEQDFRYHADRGGGAIIDCGGYPINLACKFLGSNPAVAASEMHSTRGHDVDTYGCATLQGEDGVSAQVSWGMDNVYRCNVELFGSTGIASADRVFSPPADMKPVITIRDNSGVEEIVVDAEDQFMRSFDYFARCTEDPALREQRYKEILTQARLIQTIIDNQ